MNLYETLGVPRGADVDAIKRAYRKLAMAMHPDRGGKAEDFQRLAHAYEVLTDTERRARYDQTGDDQQTDQRSEALQELASVVFKVIGNAKDPIEATRQIFLNRIDQVHHERTRHEIQIRALEKERTRIRHRNADGGPIGRMVDHQIAAMRGDLERSQDYLDRFDQILAILSEHSYSADAAGAVPHLIFGG